jgi:hypothetical protein
MGPFFGRLSVVAAILAVATTAVPRTAEVTNDHVWRQFSARVEKYVAQRRQLDLPRHVSANPGALFAAEDALANGVRALRPGAQAGEVFGPDAAAFRRRIAETLHAHGYKAADVLAEINSEAPGVQPLLTVNGRFDWRFGAFMPPCVVAALPPLPGELQYRFVGRDLVLIDIDAGVIVDVMPRALEVN